MTLPVSIKCTAGSSVQLLAQLELDASSSSYANSAYYFDPNTGIYVPGPGESLSGFATEDFSHTAIWNGITSVTSDDDGSTLPADDWSISSASGFDYTQAAVDTPEPGMIAIALISSMLLLQPRAGQSNRTSG